MFCQKCGKEIDNEAIVCTNCGCAVKKDDPTITANQQNYSQSKAGMGVLLGLFLGLIGLVIGLCIYPDNTVSRQTFIKAWAITFGVSVGVSILLSIVYFAVFASIYYPGV